MRGAHSVPQATKMFLDTPVSVGYLVGARKYPTFENIRRLIASQGFLADSRAWGGGLSLEP